MSSEWSSIVSTLADLQKMTLLTVLPRSRTDNLKGRGATLTDNPWLEKKNKKADGSFSSTRYRYT